MVDLPIFVIFATFLKLWYFEYRSNAFCISKDLYTLVNITNDKEKYIDKRVQKGVPHDK
jgi:hypothetical protein